MVMLQVPTEIGDKFHLGVIVPKSDQAGCKMMGSLDNEVYVKFKALCQRLHYPEARLMEKLFVVFIENVPDFISLIEEEKEKKKEKSIYSRSQICFSINSHIREHLVTICKALGLKQVALLRILVLFFVLNHKDLIRPLRVPKKEIKELLQNK